MLDKISDFVVDYIWEPLVDSLVWIWEVCSYCTAAVYDFLCDFTFFSACSVLDLFPTIDLSSLLSGWDFTSFLNLITTMNVFVPIVECASSVLIFIFAVSSYFIVKLIIKLIPTIG